MFFIAALMIILLICVLAFIFTGMRAFSMGGGLSAVINSTFPVIGGSALGRENDKKKAGVMDKDEIRQKVDSAMSIIASSNV